MLASKIPLGSKVPKFNIFDGHGDPIAHLMDYHSGLVGIENNECKAPYVRRYESVGEIETWKFYHV